MGVSVKKRHLLCCGVCLWGMLALVASTGIGLRGSRSIAPSHPIVSVSSEGSDEAGSYADDMMPQTLADVGQNGSLLEEQLVALEERPSLHHHRSPGDPLHGAGGHSGDRAVPYASSSISASHVRHQTDRHNERSTTTTTNDTIYRLPLSHSSAQKKNGAEGHDGSSSSSSTTTAVADVDRWPWIFLGWVSAPDCFAHSQHEHLYYQIGHGLFLIAFLGPNSVYGVLWLRCFALAGCVLMLLWGWLVACSFDVIGWFSLFLAVNALYAIVLGCRLRPVKFDKEIESVCVSLFEPLRVSRYQFKKVLNCMKMVRSLKYQEIYAQEKVTKVDSLSLVLSGKLVVSQNLKALHIVFARQFLDTPEWFGVPTDDYFQVSIMAMEESRVLVWHRDKLKLSIMADPFLQTVFEHILSRDVVKKLLQATQISEKMAQSNNSITSSGDSEDKPMLVAKSKISDNAGHCITAAINRQLQDESSPLLRGFPADNPLAIEMEKMAMKGKVVPIEQEAAFTLRDPEALRRGKWL
uniref:Putative blood vessel epicardial substance n=2 Tax=Anopheles marajoara TaxID=58244 RepID=A0A2M4BKH1_9DIPT